MLTDIYDPSYVRALFNRMSSSYERVNYITSFGFCLRWRRQFLQQIKRSNEQLKIIDLMTGMGETWTAITHRFPNASLSALDFSEGMLKHARNKNKKHFGGKVEVYQQDILENKLPANHYDLVLCCFGLKTFNAGQLSIIANETKRILKPGGQFSFIEVSKPENRLLRQAYQAHLKQVVPVAGKLLLGNPIEYRMLWYYVDAFSNAKESAQIFKEAGLIVQYDEYFFGCASGLHGYKA